MARLIDADSIEYEKRTECFGHGEFFEVQKAYKEDIDRMPTIEVGKWIPVTERLPENEKPYEEYLVNIMEDHFPISTWDDYPYCTEYVTVARFDDKQKLWHLHGGNTALNALILPEDSRVNTASVTHWMPLPEPPKEVE